MGVNTVFDLLDLSVPGCSRDEGALRLEIAGCAMLEAAGLCACADTDAASSAAKNTVESGALHMNYPLLEQAQVCFPRL